MESYFRAGIEVDSKAHRVGIAEPDGTILEGVDVSRTQWGGVLVPPRAGKAWCLGTPAERRKARRDPGSTGIS